jgi:hypothetical protein
MTEAWGGFDGFRGQALTRTRYTSLMDKHALGHQLRRSFYAFYLASVCVGAGLAVLILASVNSNPAWLLYPPSFVLAYVYWVPQLARRYPRIVRLEP